MSMQSDHFPAGLLHVAQIAENFIVVSVGSWVRLPFKPEFLCLFFHLFKLHTGVRFL